MATSIIMARSETGIPICFNGERSLSSPIVSSKGGVVRVRRLLKIIARIS